MALEIVNGMQGSNDWGVSTGDNSGVFPDNVMQSFYFNDKLEPAGQFKLLSLDLSYGYNLKFFGSIETGFNIVTNFTANGETVSNNQTDNSTEVVGINGIIPDSEGSILFNVQEAPGSTWAIFNAFVVEAYPSTANQLSNTKRASGAPVIGNREVNFGNQKIEVVAWPNPVDDRLNLQLNGVKDQVEIEIIDILGSRVFSGSYEAINESVEISLDNEIEVLQSGFYNITIKSGAEVINQKFIKN